MQVHTYKNTDEVIQELAKWITTYIRQILQKQDHFTVALSGGETPKNLYKILSEEPYCSKIEWNKVHVFWGDERVVPFTDASNNAKMAYDNFLNKVAVPAANIHIMKTDVAPENSAREYEKILHQYFDEKDRSFDLVLLGMGKDGHTLSLFPHSAILNEQHNWVNSVSVDDQKMYRITLMPSVVNKAAAIIFLVTGNEKSQALHKVLEGPFEPFNYPSQLIKPLNDELHWFVDENAAAELRQKNY
jgi:6-phosphogluconolactonase